MNSCRKQSAAGWAAGLALCACLSYPACGALVVSVDRSSGRVELTNGGVSPLSIAGYALLSDAGALDPAAWRSIAQFGDIDSGGPAPGDFVDADDRWNVFVASPSELTETTLGELTIEIGQPVDLGLAFLRGPFEDLRVEYIRGDGAVLDGSVEYVSQPAAIGDLNFDGQLDGADWQLYKADFNSDLSSLTPAQAYLRGDFDGDLMNNSDDFRILKQQFTASGAAVPEPATVATLLTLAGLTGLRRWRRT